MIMGDAKKDTPPCPVTFGGTRVRHGLTPADCIYIDNPWCFALAHDVPQAGPEFCGFHSMKLQVKGQREIIAASFEKLELFVQGTVGASGTLSLARVTDTLAEANVAMLEAMLKAGVEIWHSVVPSVSAVVIPWGFIVCEKAVNAEDVFGLRWTCIGDSAPPPFLKLASYMAPDGQGAKANSTAALLAKVLKAMEPKDKPVALAPASLSGSSKDGKSGKETPVDVKREGANKVSKMPVSKKQRTK